MSGEPVPQPSGSRGRVPPRTPTAVGLLERPDGEPPPPPPPSLWERVKGFVARLLRRRPR